MTTMTFQEFVQQVEANDPLEQGGARSLKPLRCTDGFRVSVQASRFHYCTPRTTTIFSRYTAYELGYPSEADDLIAEYAENPHQPTDTVYAWVPRDVVARLIEKHGGIKA